MPKLAIGVDFGATNMRAGLVGYHGNLINQSARSTQVRQPAQQIIRNLVGMLKLIGRMDEIAGIGLGVPGPLDIGRGRILNPPNLPTLHSFDLINQLRSQFPCPVAMDNDANCALLGEAWLGAAKSYRDVIMLTLGSGIGGAMIEQGRIKHGSAGSMEFGHLVNRRSDSKCECGQIGCLEADLGGLAIQKRYHRSLRDIFKGADEGQASDEKIFQQWITALISGLSQLEAKYRPALFILGGGVSNDFAQLKPRLLREIETKVVKAKLGGEAGIFGAAKLIFG